MKARFRKYRPEDFLRVRDMFVNTGQISEKPINLDFVWCPDPEDWPTIFSYVELQRAPDYRKDLDLYIVGPDGEYVACCTVWYDRHTPMGRLEPVGSHPAFRGMGLGREVVMEGARRAAALGALKVAGGDVGFYEAIGFRKTYASHTWTKGF